MSEALTLARQAPTTARTATALVVAGAASAALGFALAEAFSESAPAVAVVAGAAVGLLGTLALALARFDMTVVVGCLLLGAVRVEPAPTDLILGVAIATAFVTGRFAADRIPRGALMFVGAFLALNLLASVNAVDAGRVLTFFSTTLYLCVFALWLSVYVDRPSRARLVVVAYLWAACASAVLGLAALELPVPGRALFIEGPRAVALFKDPNVFGPFLIPAALILIDELAAPRLLRLRMTTKFALLVLLSAGVLFSFSRAAWLNYVLGVAVVVAVLLLRRGNAARALKLLVVLMLAGGVILATVAATRSSNYIHERAALQSYDAERFNAQRMGLHVAETYPIGIGPGQFETLPGISAHSTYVRALAEEGVIGFGVLALLFLLTLYWSAANVLRGGAANGIGSAALLGAWCGMLPNGLFIDTVHWRHLWLVAGLIWAGEATYRARAGARQ